MNQEKAKSGLFRPKSLYKPLCVTALLCSCLIASPLNAYAADAIEMTNGINQVSTIKGKIVDSTGEPIIGASIVQAGTTVGTITDMDGNFTLNVPLSATLKISYIGYITQQVKASKNLKVVLKEDNKTLDEVVVVGYGTVKKRDLTGAVSSVKQETITLTPASNPMESLQGRVAGLDITKSSGQAGTGVSMQLRGNRSITASGNPLFIIDGMPGDYSTLNPNDIESIEVLKDASSTAVYGSSGANGVIIITTKKGEEGKLNVNLNTYMGFNGWSVLPTMRSGEGYMETIREARREAGTYIDESDLVDSSVYEAYKAGKNIDWAKALMQTGAVQNYSLSVSGASKRTKGYFSLNYSDEDGQYTNDNYKVYSSKIRVDHEVNKWLATGINVQGAYTMQEKTYSKLYNALVASPYGDLYNEDGTLNPYPVAGDNKQVNLLLDQNQDVYQNSTDKLKLYVNPYIRITPMKGLTLESRLNGSLNYSTGRSFNGYGSYQMYDALGTGALNATDAQKAEKVSASISNSHSWSYQWENILTYNFKIAKVHDFTFTGVSTYNYSQSESSSASNTAFTSNSYKWTNLGVGAGVKGVSSGYSMSKGMGLIQRLSYSYMGRYLFSASLREDASSKLAKGNRWSSFPAVSAGWRISDESFMQDTKSWLDNMKLRVGYGETGTAGINPYSSQTILSAGNTSLAGEKLAYCYYPQTVSNPNLTWERSKNTNIGLDMAFLNNRIELTADYYITKTTGVIWAKTLPITSGGYNASTYYKTNVNMASTKNNGLEIALTTRNIVNKDFTWTSNISFATNKEKITSLGDGSQNYVTNGDYTLAVGNPIRSYYNLKTKGIWQLGEEADAAAFGMKPGDFRIDVPGLVRDSEGQYHKTIIDENGNEKTTEYNAENPYAVGDNDKQIIGHNNPDWSLGFQNTLTYKGFDLSVYTYARFGQMIKYDLLSSYSNSGTTNFPEYFNYWTSTNPSNDFPALNSERPVKEVKGYYSLPYVDGSFIKIKNITVGYTMNKGLCNKLGLQKLRLYGTITNPFVFAKSHLIKDYDPEMNGSLDYPLTKQLVFGLNLSF